MEKAIAVVVSYNRLALLSECITALRKQTRPLDAILVINNGSTDNTEAWLRSQPDITFITQENVGSGGGFNTGIAEAYKKGYSWVWCMDDDGYPEKNALENLLNAPLDNLHLRNCAVLNKEDRKSFVWRTGKYYNIDQVKTDMIHGYGHPFNGTLIHRTIIERVGIPRKELFLWGDESEYYQRIITKNKIPVTTVVSSIHYHPAAAFTYKKDWDYSTNWKMYYYIRNRFHTQQTMVNSGFAAAVKYACFLVAIVGITLVYQKTEKFKKISFIAWPAKDAITNNFNRTPDSILTKLNKPRRSITWQAPLLYLKYMADSVSTLFASTETRRTANI